MEEPKETLWRYMPFAQLVRMLQTQKLWVSHVSSFEDKLEGTLDFTHWKINPDVRKDAIENLISAFSNTYVSCWHSASSESLAFVSDSQFSRGGASLAQLGKVVRRVR